MHNNMSLIRMSAWSGMNGPVRPRWSYIVLLVYRQVIGQFYRLLKPTDSVPSIFSPGHSHWQWCNWHHKHLINDLTVRILSKEKRANRRLYMWGFLALRWGVVVRRLSAKWRCYRCRDIQQKNLIIQGIWTNSLLFVFGFVVILKTFPAKTQHPDL